MLRALPRSCGDSESPTPTREPFLWLLSAPKNHLDLTRTRETVRRADEGTQAPRHDDDRPALQESWQPRPLLDRRSVGLLEPTAKPPDRVPPAALTIPQCDQGGQLERLAQVRAARSISATTRLPRSIARRKGCACVSVVAQVAPSSWGRTTRASRPRKHGTGKRPRRQRSSRGARDRVVRVEPSPNPSGFGHAWLAVIG